MITMRVSNYKTNEVISESKVADNWWPVYWLTALHEGRSVIKNADGSCSILFAEKNKVYTFSH